jgi:2-keto-3-deoxy-L-rhamnonate aldolase RhmA
MLRVSRNPAVCYLARNGSLDFVMFDCEHSNYTYETLHDMFIMGNALGLGGLLRVPVLSRDYISRALDCGAAGAMVPMTETPEQAEEIVRWSKYSPLGERGYGSGCAHTDYVGGGKHEAIMGAANQKIISIAQIETRLAVDNADQIAAVNGIDVLLIGPNDLSISLGIPGDFMNPVELDAIAHVAACCKKHGKFFGLHAGLKLLEKFSDDLSFVMSQSDTDILAQGFARINASCREIE